MQIIIIRHLPTEWNKSSLLQGSKDIPIEKDAISAYQDSIKANLERIKQEEPFDAVLVSSLCRTKQTARAYGFRNPVIEPLMDELNFGRFEARPKRELVSFHGDKWVNDPRDLVLGESLIEFENRIIAFLNKWKNHERLLLFGHGSWMRALISIQQHGTLSYMNQFEIANNELKEIELFLSPTGRWNKKLSVINQTYKVNDVR